MNPYEPLIRQEQAKLELLRAKVASCEQRIAALQSLAQSDDVDDALASAVIRASAPATVSPSALTPALGVATGAEAAVESSGSLTMLQDSNADGRKVRSDSVVLDVLAFLQAGEKSLDEVANHLVAVGKGRSDGYLRTALMNWRVKNGWVLNPHPGRYGLSDAGLSFLTKNSGLKGESLSSANAEAFSLQPPPGSGTATVGVRRRVVVRRTA